MNFSATNYRAEVNATNVTVRVMAFGSFHFTFLLEVIPKTVDTPEGNDTVTTFWDSIYFSGDQLFFDDDLKEVLFPLRIHTALVTIELFPEEVENMDLRFNVTLVVSPGAMSQGVILSEPSMATVTVPTSRGEIYYSNYIAIWMHV